MKLIKTLILLGDAEQSCRLGRANCGRVSIVRRSLGPGIIAVQCLIVQDLRLQDIGPIRLLLLHFLKASSTKHLLRPQKQTSSHLIMTEDASNHPEDEGGKKGPGSGLKYRGYREKPQEETVSDFSNLTDFKDNNEEKEDATST